eukprot:gene5079-34877_t
MIKFKGAETEKHWNPRLEPTSAGISIRPPRDGGLQEYDPGLAAATLARTHEHSESAKEQKRNQMLADLGLGDEGFDIEDDEDDDEDDDFDVDEDMLPDGEQPIFSNGSRSKAKASGSSSSKPASYGYRDVFGKEFLRQRQQQIDIKVCAGRFVTTLLFLLRVPPSLFLFPGRCFVSAVSSLIVLFLWYRLSGYRRFLEQLLHRSNESLQLLRSDTALQYPGSVEIIGELEHEIDFLHQENCEMKELAASGASPLMSPSAAAPSAADSHRMEQMEAELASFRDQVVGMERLIQSKDERIRDVQSQLRKASDASEPRSPVAATGVSAAGGAAAGGAAGAAVMSAASKKQIAELERQCDELEARNKSLEADLVAAKAESRRKTADLANMAANSDDKEAAELAVQVSSLTAAAAAHAVHVAKLEKQIKQLKSENSEAETKVSRAKSAAASEVSGKMTHMYSIIDEVHKLRESVLAELLAVQNEVFNDRAMKDICRGVRDKEIQLTRQIHAASEKAVSDSLRRAAEAKEDLSTLQSRCDEKLRIQQIENQGMITHFKDKWKTEFDRRRKLHNQVLQFKGNIRVLCRVRPYLLKDLALAGGEEPPVLEFKGNIRVLCRVRPYVAKELALAGGEEPPVKAVSEELVRVPAGPNGADKEFEFDRVFGIKDGQETVFDEVQGLVVSVLDGYNVSIMAYGQTGSGKTFTMEGPDDNPGVNLRALAALFTMAQERSGVFEYTFSASVLEIYNEQIFDLLAGGRDQEDKLDVKQNTAGGMHVPGLSVEIVANEEEVHRLINKGRGNRSTFATNMNEHSSRSHLVLSVYITGVNSKTNQSVKGKLHLIDLAGSERIARTNAQGDRLKEAQNINKSLSALGDVIQALQQKNAHIPYRNSKLTRLLEDSLGNNAKCIMVVNVSPAAENTGETKCSLEFASRARKVELGKARANVEGSPSRGTRSPGGGTPDSLSRVNSMSNVSSPAEGTPRAGSKLRAPGR